MSPPPHRPQLVQKVPMFLTLSNIYYLVKYLLPCQIGRII